MPLALFRFEASATIGAGHAIRSTVVADALIAKGWECQIITDQITVDLIPSLKRFLRRDAEDLLRDPQNCDLLVIDHYGLEAKDEMPYRSFARKILVIDDLANRPHDCDILLDQTYERHSKDYQHLVPEHCRCLTGGQYILLREEFIALREEALKKREKTSGINTILVSMGGTDSGQDTLRALKMIKESGFKGKTDIVLGFLSKHMQAIGHFMHDWSYSYTLFVNANMPQRILEADLAIGAAGSSVWERCCLGLPSVLLCIADNQKDIYRSLMQHSDCIYSNLTQAFEQFPKRDLHKLSIMVNPYGVSEVIKSVVDSLINENIIRQGAVFHD
jgi:UDP-2,4-diacetamido-2,4,6-trideoxy-beta-L-altropyranose hydrolase